MKLFLYRFVKPYRWKPSKPTHGPKIWPWWKLLVVRAIRTSATYVAWNIWVYSRWGAWCFGFYPMKKWYWGLFVKEGTWE